MALGYWRHYRRAAALCVLLAPAPVLAGALRVTQFSPQGTVKRVRQVTARFSEPMVTLGDPRGAGDPFETDCAEKGAGRWIDSRSWAFDFARDLPAGVRCTFRVRAGLRATGGEVLRERSFTFSTGGPAVTASTPSEGSDAIDEEQVFALSLDGEPTAASVLAHAWFRVDGIASRVGLRIVTGAEREAIVKTLSRDTLASPLLLVQARQRFPSGGKVSLVWGAGVAAPSGVVTMRDQVLRFGVRPAFTARFSCQRAHAHADCIPFTAMNVHFSAPVAWATARKIVLVGPDDRRWPARAPDDDADIADGAVYSVTFKAPFPELASFRIELPADLRDDAGRTLLNAGEYPVVVKTAAFPPLAKFASRFGIIEANAEPALPVTVRNLEPEVQGQLQRLTGERAGGVGAAVKGVFDRITGSVSRVPPERPEEILPWLRRVNRARRSASVFGAQQPDGAPPPAASPATSFTLPKPNGAKAFEVMGIPLGAPGLYIVELASAQLGAALLGRNQPMYVPTAALVTNLSVHFKWGGENSLVWVTTLDTARPVDGARVSIQDCTGTVLWSGESDGDGLARVSGLPAREALPNCYASFRPPSDAAPDYYDDAGETLSLNALNDGLFIVAQTRDDLSFVHSGWSQGIEPWRFQLPSDSWAGPIVAHTIFDRALLRAGETLHMKHLLRRLTLDGFSLVPATFRPATLSIRHEGSNEQHEMPVEWDASGSAESTWRIPKEAKLGRYTVVFTIPGVQSWRSERRSGSFRVEEFRVPLMKAVLRVPPEPQVAAAAVPVDVSVQYFAGGPAAQLPVRLRAQIRPGSFRPPDEFEHFTFGNGGVEEGVTRSGVDEAESATSDGTAKAGVHQRQDLVLDDAGAARSAITDLPPSAALRELLTELEFRDPNGETQTVAATTALWPAQRLVGIKAEDWVRSTDRLSTKVAVVDTAGRPVAGASARVEVRQRKTYSHRKRLVGGFYAYEHVEQIGPVLATLCEGPTNANGWLLCEGTPPADGNLILQASATDDAGNASTAHVETWVAGEAETWFRVENSDRIDLLAEKPRYEPGETARLQVRMPFRQATALVTTEREGILDATIVRLSGTDPVVEVPVKDAHAPNVFVSVLAVRGRVGDVQPTATVDLGRPAFKLGIAEIRVGWRAHELNVSVTTDRPVYHVRERAAVRIAVRAPDGSAPPPGSEVAVAAVDEGLLELQPNTSWNLLEAMMQRRGYGVRTATAQLQVVGKRHFGLKAVPHGGGGGRRTTRELFDTLLLWQARVALDANGDAAVDVPLNDSLTSFRIAAVATGGVGRFGGGATSIRSTQDLMLLSGLPPLVREGDQFRAEFTVRNATERAMEVRVAGRIDVLTEPLAPQTVVLAPGAAAVVGWSLRVPTGAAALQYEMEATEARGAMDRLRVAQQVRPAVPVRTFQATLRRLDRPLREAVARPPDALPGRGDVRVTLAPSLAGALGGVRDWMRGYPFTCLEQKVSRAVALRDEQLWREVTAVLPAHLDGDGLLTYFPAMPAGSEVLTAYVLAVSHAAGLTLSPAVQEKMEGGLRKFIDGALIRLPQLRTADLPLRKLAAIEALARVGKAAPEMLSSVSIEPNLWPTSAVLDWWSILRRVPRSPRHDERAREAEQIVRARLNLQGTTMGFSTERSDNLWWLMVCPDTTAVRLALQLVEASTWTDDLPRVLRGALGRQRRGHWDCTVTNAWGVLAVERFAAAFEATPVTGSVAASLGAVRERAAWAEPAQDLTFDLPWPSKSGEVAVTHTGSGTPWVTIQSRAAIPLKRPLSSGYRITKTITPVETQAPGAYTRGDILRVRLDVEAQSDMTWVVVSDPIPAGAAHLGSALARDSPLSTEGEAEDLAVHPAFQERAFEAFRAYYAYVPKGTFAVEYTMRLNQSGRFELPATRVEALYAPEMFGELPNAALEVGP